MLTSARIWAQSPPALLPSDRVRLAEAFALKEAVSEQVWLGWRDVPFAVLLVTPDHEYLIRHPRPSSDFQPLGYDSLLRSQVYYRARTFDPKLQATFPAVGGISTVVIGQAENTQSKTSTPWVVTLLHEHFHQLQTARPDYYAAVNTLNLSGGDQTGMWMLNYPFPYAQPTVEQAYAQLTQHLLAALNAPNAKLRSRYADAYRKAKAAMQRTVSASDYRYFGFQVWQEGVARYTEYRVALAAADGYQPTAAFRALPDYRPYAEHATALKTAGLRELAAGPLSRQQRVAFYPLGLAEALLLDKVSPDWRRRYLAERFGTDGYFKP